MDTKDMGTSKPCCTAFQAGTTADHYGRGKTTGTSQDCPNKAVWRSFKPISERETLISNVSTSNYIPSGSIHAAVHAVEDHATFLVGE